MPTKACVETVAKHGFRLHTGFDKSEQPGDVADILLHETAVACFKKALDRTPPQAPAWKDTRQDFAKRVAGVVREANGPTGN